MMANLVKLHAWGWGEGVRKIPIEGLWETSPHIGRTVGRESLLSPSSSFLFIQNGCLP